MKSGNIVIEFFEFLLFGQNEVIKLVCYFDFSDFLFFTYLVAFHCSNVEKSDLKITSKMNKLLFWPLSLHQINSWFTGSGLFSVWIVLFMNI